MTFDAMVRLQNQNRRFVSSAPAPNPKAAQAARNIANLIAYFDKNGEWPGLTDPQLGKVTDFVRDQFNRIANSKPPSYLRHGYTEEQFARLRSKGFAVRQRGISKPRGGAQAQAMKILESGGTLPDEMVDMFKKRANEGNLSPKFENYLLRYGISLES